MYLIKINTYYEHFEIVNLFYPKRVNFMVNLESLTSILNVEWLYLKYSTWFEGNELLPSFPSSPLCFQVHSRAPRHIRAIRRPPAQRNRGNALEGRSVVPRLVQLRRRGQLRQRLRPAGIPRDTAQPPGRLGDVGIGQGLLRRRTHHQELPGDCARCLLERDARGQQDCRPNNRKSVSTHAGRVRLLNWIRTLLCPFLDSS